jgi:hypothetical protein
MRRKDIHRPGIRRGLTGSIQARRLEPPAASLPEWRPWVLGRVRLRPRRGIRHRARLFIQDKKPLLPPPPLLLLLRLPAASAPSAVRPIRPRRVFALTVDVRSRGDRF